MALRLLLTVMLSGVTAYAGSVFVEDTELWADIDRINIALESSGEMDSAVLEEIFQETVEIALSFELAQQFEDLRMDAFESGDFGLCDEYADRAYNALNVFILGESNAIGVNTAAFLDMSVPESEAYIFFLVSVGGFYVNGGQRIGTAEFPAWMERSESSAQAVIDSVKAKEWLGYWQSVRPLLDGYFLTIADETILGLRADVE